MMRSNNTPRTLTQQQNFSPHTPAGQTKRGYWSEIITYRHFIFSVYRVMGLCLFVLLSGCLAILEPEEEFELPELPGISTGAIIIELYNPENPEGTPLMSSGALFPERSDNEDFELSFCLNTYDPYVVYIPASPDEELTPAEATLVETEAAATTDEVVITLVESTSTPVDMHVPGSYTQTYVVTFANEQVETFTFNVIVGCTSELRANVADNSEFITVRSSKWLSALNTAAAASSTETPLTLELPSCWPSELVLSHLEDQQTRSTSIIAQDEDNSENVDLSIAGSYLQTYNSTNTHGRVSTFVFILAVETCPPQISISLQTTGDKFIDLDKDDEADHTLTLTDTPSTTTTTTAAAAATDTLSQNAPTVAKAESATLTNEQRLVLDVPACAPYNPNFIYKESLNPITAGFTISLTSTPDPIDTNTPATYTQVITVTYDDPERAALVFEFDVVINSCEMSSDTLMSETETVAINPNTGEVVDYHLTLDSSEDAIPTLTIPACLSYLPIFNIASDNIDSATSTTGHIVAGENPIDVITPATYPIDILVSNAYGTTFAFPAQLVVTSQPSLCLPQLRVVLHNVNDEAIDLEPATSALQLVTVLVTTDDSTQTLTVPVCAPYIPNFAVLRSDILITSAVVSLSESQPNAIDTNSPDTYTETYQVLDDKDETTSFTYHITIASCVPTLTLTMLDEQARMIDNNDDNNADHHYILSPTSSTEQPTAITLPSCLTYHPDIVYAENELAITMSTFAPSSYPAVGTASGEYPQSHVVTNLYGIITRFDFIVTVPNCERELEVVLNDAQYNPIDLNDDATPDHSITLSPGDTLTLPACAPYHPSFQFLENGSVVPNVILTAANSNIVTLTTPAEYPLVYNITNELGTISTFAFTVTVPVCAPTLAVTLLDYAAPQQPIPITMAQTSTTTATLTTDAIPTLSLPACAPYQPRLEYAENTISQTTAIIAANSGQAVITHTAGTYLQEHIVTNAYGQTFNLSFTIATSNCTEAVLLTLNNAAGNVITTQTLPLAAATHTVTLPSCASYNPVLTYMLTDTPLTTVTIGANSGGDSGSDTTVTTTPGTYPQQHDFVDPYGAERSLTFTVTVTTCAAELSVTLNDIHNNNLGSTIVTSDSPAVINLPACSPYLPIFSYYEASEQVSTVTIDANSAATTISSSQPSTATQTHRVTNTYGEIHEFTFTLTVEACHNTLALTLLDDLGTPLTLNLYNGPIIATAATAPTVTVPYCTPYNPAFSYSEDASTTASVVISSNLATVPIDTASPATYSDTRAVTNAGGYVTTFTTSVVIQACNEDILLTLSDENGSTIATEVIPISPATSTIPSITIIPCTLYHASAVYRINETEISTVTVGTNRLASITLTPATYPQQYSFSNQYAETLTINFNVIVPTCNSELRISFNAADGTTLSNASVIAATPATLTLPACMPYYPSFRYAQNNIVIAAAVIAVNSTSTNIPATRPENSVEQTHLVTNQYGIIYDFTFVISATPCAAALELLLTDNLAKPINIDANIASVTTTPTLTLPTCAPYIPSFRYSEANSVQTATISPNNLATTTIDPTAPATYTESRSVTNNLGFLSEFSFSVTVSECSPTLSLSFLTVDGTTTLLDPAALSLTPADNPTIAFPPCAPTTLTSSSSSTPLPSLLPPSTPIAQLPPSTTTHLPLTRKPISSPTSTASPIPSSSLLPSPPATSVLKSHSSLMTISPSPMILLIPSSLPMMPTFPSPFHPAPRTTSCSHATKLPPSSPVPPPPTLPLPPSTPPHLILTPKLAPSPMTSVSLTKSPSPSSSQPVSRTSSSPLPMTTTTTSPLTPSRCPLPPLSHPSRSLPAPRTTTPSPIASMVMLSTVLMSATTRSNPSPSPLPPTRNNTPSPINSTTHAVLTSMSSSQPAQVNSASRSRMSTTTN